MKQNDAIPADTFPVVYLASSAAARACPTALAEGAFLPGAQARISPFDRGFLVGDGLFETLHVDRGVPLSLAWHVERLLETARFVRLDVPPDESFYAELLRELVARNGLGAGEAVARVTITRGVGGAPTIFAFLREVAAGHRAKRQRGAVLYQLPDIRHGGSELARHKTTSYLASSLGQAFLAIRTSDPRAEGLFVTRDGRALEGTMSNLFIVEGRVVVSPPVTAGVLPGTSRRAVIEAAGVIGLEVREEMVDLARLARADEVFITSSTLPMAAVTSLDDAPLGAGPAGPRFAALRAEIAARVEREVRAWHRLHGA